MDVVIPAVLIALTATVAYFLPTLIAAFRGARHLWPIAMLNLFTGWTIVGWLAALVWSLTGRTGP